jgi:hypothetical protein
MVIFHSYVSLPEGNGKVYSCHRNRSPVIPTHPKNHPTMTSCRRGLHWQLRRHAVAGGGSLRKQLLEAGSTKLGMGRRNWRAAHIRCQRIQLWKGDFRRQFFAISIIFHPFMYQLQTLSGGPVGFRAACKPQQAASANLLGYNSRYTLHIASYLFILNWSRPFLRVVWVLTDYLWNPARRCNVILNDAGGCWSSLSPKKLMCEFSANWCWWILQVSPGISLDHEPMPRSQWYPDASNASLPLPALASGDSARAL